MSVPILDKDTEIRFPHFLILKASAGSGKTYALTERFVQFILSEKIPHSSLRNILAVTFSNNAAKEMKERVLFWLKSVCFDDPESTVELSGIVSLDAERMKEKAGELIEEILDNYSDFQVKTIDSFMTTVFKASAIDFGYNPEFDILMSTDALMDYSFNRFLRNVRQGTGEAGLFGEIVSGILEQKRQDASFPWDPSKLLLDEIKKIYKKLSSTGREARIEDFSAEMQKVRERIRAEVEELEHMVSEAGLPKNRNSAYCSVLDSVRQNRFADLTGKPLKNPPVNKPDKKQQALQTAYDMIGDKWIKVVDLIRTYTACHARNYYAPYLRVYDIFREKIEAMKRQQGKIFIEDINRYLAEYLGSDIVPDVYFRLGETVFHFLIDEFQDTSPVQWRNLKPLIENSLSQGGSLFIVGDTKQAIYGFRDADYTIMKEAEKTNYFPSAEHIVKELKTNYRSRRKVLDFNEKVFKKNVAASDVYNEAGEQSGLTDYVQKAKDGDKGDGYAEVVILERDDENPSEKEKIQEIILELITRGYNYNDIAVLTQRNEDAVRVTSWLNEKGIDFISYSSLDIRRRQCIGELVSLLNFLDSPTDDLSFASFLLGDIFNSILSKDSVVIPREQIRAFLFKCRNTAPVYKAFQKDFENLWKRYFDGLFRSAGYLPLYDLVTEIFSVFRVFEIMETEEAALVKILEAVKEFEGAGFNSLRDFLEFSAGADGGESAWNMDVPRELSAVKVMTVHKSKGLGFPVVIVLLYEGRNRGFDHLLEDVGEEVCLVRLTKDTAKCDPALESIYHEECVKEMVNRLNSLYVGFTRAEQELYVVGVRGKKEGFPFDLLPAEDFPPSVRPDRADRVDEIPRETLATLHHHRKSEYPVRSDELLNVTEKRRGEFIHRVLYFVEYMQEGFEETLEQIIKKAAAETGFEGSDTEKIGDSVREFVEGDDMAEYFRQQPGRKIMREQEFSDAAGALYRMDRVVIDGNTVTVIDYKTGSDKGTEGKYGLQMKAYMNVLREIFPDRIVAGVIAYVDLKEIREIH